MLLPCGCSVLYLDPCFFPSHLGWAACRPHFSPDAGRACLRCCLEVSRGPGQGLRSPLGPNIQSCAEAAGNLCVGSCFLMSS